jgi:hypothetical protein
MGLTCGTYRDKRNAYRILGGKNQSKGPQGRPKRRWEDNIIPYPANVENMVSL